MDENVVIRVDVDAQKVQQQLNSVSVTLADLKNEQKALKKEIEDGKDATGELSSAYAQNAQQIQLLTAEQKSLIGQLQTTAAESDTLGTSFRELDAQVRSLENQYKSLTAEQRNSAAGQEMKKALIEGKEQLKQFDAELGNHQRNVGNYPQVWEGVVPGLGKVQGVLRGMGTSLSDVGTKGMAAFKGLGQSAKAFGKAMITPPVGIIVAIVGAIVLVVQKLVDAFKKNDNAMTALQRAFAAFQPILDAVNAIFEALANVIAKVVEGLANAASAIIGFLVPSYKEAADEARNLVDAQDALEQAERDYTENSARRNMEIAKKRAEAANKEKYTAAQRMQILRDAMDLEKKNLEEDKRIKAEQLRILEETARRERDTSDETKNKIAAARAAMYQAEQNYFTGVRNLQKQYNSAQTEIDNEKKAAQEEAKRKAQEAAQKRKQAAQEAKQRRQEAERQRKERAAEAKRRAEENAKIVADEQAKLQAQQDVIRRRMQSDLENQIEDLKKAQAKELAVKGLGEDEKLKITQYYLQEEQKLRDAAAKAEAAKAEAAEKEAAEKRKEAQDYLAGMREQTLDEQYTAELQQLQDYYDEGLILTEEYEAAKAQVEEQYRLAKADAQTQQAAEYLAGLEQLNTAIAGIEDAAMKRFENSQDEQKKALEKRLKSGELSQEKYDKEVAKIDEETERRKIQMEREQAVREKALGIMNATISTATAIIKALADPGGLAGLALSIMAGATGAAQIAAIAATPLPQFAHGGIVGGNAYSGDRILTRQNSREMDLTLDQQRNLFNAISSDNGQTIGINYEMMAAAMASVPAPVMVYSEFEEFGKDVTTIKEIASV